MDEQLNTDLRFSIVPEWVLDADVSDRAVRLYSVLARYADNETLQAFPSRETLAKRCKCHTKSIDRAIDELVLLGAIAKRHRKANNGYQSNIYTLRRIPTPQSPPRDNADARVGTPQSPPGDTGVELTITTELEPSNVKPLNYKNEKFDSFWDVYPRKENKPRARKEFDKAIKRVEFTILLAGAERYRDDPNRNAEYTMHPSTWLHNDSWENELLPQRERKLTNAENAAMLAMKYREQAKAIEETNITYGDWSTGGKELN